MLVAYRVLGLNSDCLSFSEPVPRYEIGDAMSNKDEIIASAFYDSRVLNFTTCVDTLDVLIGI